jgi:hypothetical protein
MLYVVHRSAASRGVTGSLGDKLAIASPQKDHQVATVRKAVTLAKVFSFG